MRQPAIPTQVLQSKSMAELRQMATNMGVGNRKGESKSQLAARLSDTSFTIKEDPRKQVAETKPVVHHYSTMEQISEAVAPFVKRGLNVHFGEQDETWHFKYGIVEDSGTFKMPLTTIRMKAASVMEPKRIPHKIKTGEMAGALHA